jgi:hypothetical protein
LSWLPFSLHCLAGGIGWADLGEGILQLQPESAHHHRQQGLDCGPSRRGTDERGAGRYPGEGERQPVAEADRVVEVGGGGGGRPAHHGAELDRGEFGDLRGSRRAEHAAAFAAAAGRGRGFVVQVGDPERVQQVEDLEAFAQGAAGGGGG